MLLMRYRISHFHVIGMDFCAGRPTEGVMLRQDSLAMLFQWTALPYVLRLVKSIPTGGKGKLKIYANNMKMNNYKSLFILKPINIREDLRSHLI